MGVKGLAAYLRRIQKQKQRVGGKAATAAEEEEKEDVAVLEEEEIDDVGFEEEEGVEVSVRASAPDSSQLSLLPAGSVLVVDGSGFLFHVLEAAGERAAVVLGGDYTAFAEAVRRELNRLLQLGLRVEFFFDGEADIFKDRAQAHRAQQREAMWFDMYTSCRDGKLTVATKDLPLPPLAMDQLKVVLAKDFKSIATTRCTGEADLEIAAYVKRKNGGRPLPECRYYCYGRDSDFLVMAACPYIEFGQLWPSGSAKASAPLDGLLRGGNKGSTNAPSVQALVHWRPTTAAALGLSEVQLVELSVLCGNDFTALFPLALYRDGPPVAVQKLADARRTPQVISALIAWLLSKPSSYRLSSTNAELSLAIRYTRLYYNGLDTKGVVTELDEYRKANAIFYPKPSLLVGLSDDSRSQFESWAKSGAAHSSSSSASKSPAPPAGAAVLSYLEHLISTPSGEKKITLNDGVVHLHPHHVAAIRDMLAIVIAGGSSKSGERAPPTLPPGYVPRWSHVLLAVAYQSLLRQLKNADPTFANFEPSENFSGPVLHGLLSAADSTLSGAGTSSGIESAAPAPRTSEVIVKTPKIADPNSVSKRESVDSSSRTPVADRRAPHATAAPGSSSSRQNAPAVSNKQSKPEGGDVLPIDAFESAIVEQIQRDRVIIIHGETGCGKSTRVPVMVYKNCKKMGKPCRMMISQPRRIAASSLMKRVRGSLGNDEVGMRMGHGVRDETSSTKLFFVTAGYLVRLLAYHPESFRSHTHLIIDEVHERSVDGDLLCMLAKRLLKTHPTIKLILMSATMEIGLYQQYFASPNKEYGSLECISVGARRFPVQLFYSEDINSRSSFPRLMESCALKVTSASCKFNAESTVSQQFPKDQYTLAYNIIREAVAPGTGVLVFVSGVNDIVELSALFVNQPQYVVVPLHSEIPVEDQDIAFSAVQSDQVKVVIATNIAESSITLPDVDVVICLGTHKVVQYDQKTNRVQLVNSFISRASAAQRAGRTGRTRPGTVYRLYSKRLFESMNSHDAPEVLRKPLHDVILSLRAMLEESPGFEGVVPLLEDLIEPPNIDSINASFSHLHQYGMITSPDDEGELTAVGNMAGCLPVDMHLTRLVAFGIMLGIGAETIALAAAFSLPKSPFRIAHPLVHKDPSEFNDIMMQSFLGEVRADAGLYSTPLALVHLLTQWRELKHATDFERSVWLQKNNVVRARIHMMDMIASHLVRSVTSILKIHQNKQKGTKSLISTSEIESLLQELRIEDGKDVGDYFDEEALVSSLDASPLAEIRLFSGGSFDCTRINLCRLVIAWVGCNNVLRLKVVKSGKMTPAALNSLTITDRDLTEQHLSLIFPPSIPFTFQKRDRMIFESTLRCDSDRSYLNILESMCIVAYKCAGVKVSYRIHHDIEDKEAFMDSLAAVWIQFPTVDGDGNQQTAIVLALSDFMVDHYGDLITSVLGDLVADDEKFSGLNLFVASNVRPKTRKLLAALQDSLPASIYLVAPTSARERARLSVAYVPLTEVDGEYIFQGRISGLTPGQEKSAPKISVNIVNCNRWVQFDEPSGEFNFPNSIIADIAIGVRLFNAYKMSRIRDRFVYIKRSEHAAQTQLEQDGSIQAPQDEYFALDSSCPTAKWDVVDISPEAEFVSPRQVVMGAVNAVSTMYPINSDPVYGTAFNTMGLGGGNNVKCDSVTLFPAGAKWVTLAYLSMGVAPERLSLVIRDSVTLSKTEKSLVHLIAAQCLSSADEDINYNPVLRRAVDTLFAPWIAVASAPSAEPKANAADAVSIKSPVSRRGKPKTSTI